MSWMEYRTLWASVSAAAILRLYPDGVETKNGGQIGLAVWSGTIPDFADPCIPPKIPPIHVMRLTLGSPFFYAMRQTRSVIIRRSARGGTISASSRAVDQPTTLVGSYPQQAGERLEPRHVERGVGATAGGVIQSSGLPSAGEIGVPNREK